jgi:hypothetical protein
LSSRRTRRDQNAKPAGEAMATGRVESSGSGVPRRLCTKKFAPIVTTLGITIAAGIITASGPLPRASAVHRRMMRLPIRNV